MAEEFYRRFERLLSERGIRPEDAASVMGTGIDTVRRLVDGRTKQAKLDEALRLCDRYGIDPWELAFGKPRQPAESASLRSESPSLEVDRIARLEAELGASRAQMVRLEATVTALEAAVRALPRVDEDRQK